MFYATFLTVVILLLALGFLFSGIIVLYRQRRSSRPGQVYGIPRRGVKFTPVLVVGMPIVLGFAWFAASFAPSSAGPAPVAHSSPTANATSTVSTIPQTDLTLVAKDAITLTVGISDKTYTSPPEISYDAKNNPVGFDVDLINAIAGAMKLQVKFVQKPVIPADQLLDGLKNNQVDVVISAYAATTAETLSVPYLKPKDVLLVPSKNSTITKFNALTDLCGHTIGVQNKTSELIDLKKIQCQAGKLLTIVPFSGADAVANGLMNHEKNVEGVYQSTPTVSYYSKNTKFMGKFQQMGTKFPLDPEGILVQQDNKALQDAIQNAYNSLGTKYTQLLNNYGLTDDGVLPKPVVPSSPTAG